jgi:hypothetical protein
MQYPIRIGAQGGLIPKLAGTYECELAGVIERIVARAPRTVIDVGAAEGYYAVGLATRLPTARIVAYEMETPLHALVRRLAEANGVASRLDLRGACSVASLGRDLEASRANATLRDTVIVMDVEGFEDTLLDPAAIPELDDVAVLVEVHDTLVPGVGDRLRARFARTHSIESIRSRARSARDLPPGATLDEPEAMLDEGRTRPMDWYLLIPAR